MEADGQDPTRYKVGRLIEAYELDGMGQELEQRWRGERGERASLRELATEFNRSLVEVAVRDTDLRRFEGDVDRILDLLTEEGASRAERLRVRRELQREGVDPDALVEDFVTYQAIRSYLKEYRGIASPETGSDSRENARGAIQALSGRLTRVAESKLEGLQSTGELTLGEHRVMTSVQVYCEDCDTQRDVDELLQDGGCECE